MSPESGRINEFLLGCGADQLPHPGGTLYEHVVRVAALLAEWGADQDLQVAGLCHACYGTDGYPDALLRPGERPVLTALIGVRAESLVYLYGSCDRGTVYPAMGQGGPVPFLDRFTGRTRTPPERDIRAFTELTAANELDVMRHNAALAARHATALHQLFTDARPRLSNAAWQAWQAWSRQPGTDPAGRPGQVRPVAPVAITGLDHLVLTVTDLDQTAGFYQRVLGMRPVTFGAGRHAMEFGTSKINLHLAGQEITPHAARPVPGSADLCLITTAPPGQVLAHLDAQHVPIEDGPVPRTGASGQITSIYIRDPDGNLIEIASYPPDPATAAHLGLPCVIRSAAAAFVQGVQGFGEGPLQPGEVVASPWWCVVDWPGLRTAVCRTYSAMRRWSIVRRSRSRQPAPRQQTTCGNFLAWSR